MTTPARPLVVYAAWRQPGPPGAAAEEFSRWFGERPRQTLESNGWIVHLAPGDGARVGDDPTGRITVVLYGDLYDGAVHDPAALAREYASRGQALFSELNGSFALMVLDRTADRLLVVTDRVASRRIFHSRGEAGHYLSTAMGVQPTGQRQIDPVSVGWFLANGNLTDGRTPFDGIRILARASAHELHQAGRTASEYWSHRVGESMDAVDEAALEERLEALMVRAVQRQIDPDRDLYLSLSGGLDSIGIAAVLSRGLGIRQVRTFSYTHGDASPGQDAAVAATIAEKLGLPHRLIESYRGDPMAYLRANARLGEGASVTAFEVDIWRELAPELQEARSPILFTGEERMGFGPTDVETHREIRDRSRIGELVLTAGAERHLPPGFRQRTNEAIRREAEGIVARQPSASGGNLQDLRLEFYFDQRVSGQLMGWRGCFAGSFANVRTPWLDNDVLDFMARIPRRLRRGKVLYRRAVLRLAPELAAVEMAQREGYVPDLRSTFTAHAVELREWISQSESRLDALISVEFGLGLLDEVAGVPDRGRQWRRGAYRVKRRLTRLVGGSTPQPTAAHNVFLRWAVLRMALEESGKR